MKRPLKQLRGFKRVSLNPGETKNVVFTMGDDAFAFYDVKAKGFVVKPGEYEIQVGSSSQDIRLKAMLPLM